MRHVVAPNKSHHLYFAEFLEVFSSAQGYIAPGLDEKRSDLARFPRIATGADIWENDFVTLPLEGIPALNETA